MVILPSPMTRQTGAKARLRVDGDTLGEVVAKLALDHPGLHPWLDNGYGDLPTYTQVFVGERDARTLGTLDAPLHPDDTIRFLVEMSGG
jgi:molybdopterin converting factor small subunit